MVKSISGCLTVGKGIYVALFYILHYTHLSGICFGLKYCYVQPKPEVMSLSEAHLYATAPLLLLVLDLFMYQEQTPLIIGLNPSAPHTCQGT